MMRRQPQNELKLPQRLLDEIDQPSHHSRSSQPLRWGHGLRKELRKAARVEKRTRKGVNGARPLSKQPTVKLKPQDDCVSNSLGDRLEKRQEPVENASSGKPSIDSTKPLKSILKSTSRVQGASHEGCFTEVSEPLPPGPRLSKGIRDKLAEDDTEIKALERALGIKGKGKLPRSFKDDGLDDILAGLDESYADAGRKREKRTHDEGDEFKLNKRNRAERTGTQTILEKRSSKKVSGKATSVLDGSSDDSDDLDELVLNDSSKKSENDFSKRLPFEPVSLPAERIRENPYAPPSESDETTNKAKSTPFLRPSSKEDRERLQRLHRQLQGLLNRLTETTLPGIVRTVQELYRENARQRVSSTLLDLLFGLLSDPTTLQDTFLILHGSFIAALYKVVGADFGAQAVQRLVAELDDLSLKEREGVNIGKRLTNLVSLLAQLYNFRVVASGLLYDFIQVFATGVSEMNTELLLKIFKSSGPQLRQDDTSSLKDIATLLYEAIARPGADKLSVRAEFMIETINNLRNNRTKAGNAGNAASSINLEYIIRMKKILASLGTGGIKATEPLTVRLSDIRNSDKRGKWWLVGASYRDEDFRCGRSEHLAAPRPVSDGNSMKIEATAGDILQLAKEQRMNTNVRRSIFVTIMTATDYKDARVRLLKLHLKKSQELEIPKVLIHCAGAEKVYNPYYTLISRLLCVDRKLRIAFQFSFWDLLKPMNENPDDDDDGSDGDHDIVNFRGLNTRATVNLAKFYGTLIADGGLGLSVLKNINLAYMQPKAKTFVELLLITVIVQSQHKEKGGRSEQALVDIFQSLRDTPEMTRGIQLFMKRVVARTDVAGSQQNTGTIKWGCKVADDVLTAIASDGVADKA